MARPRLLTPPRPPQLTGASPAVRRCAPTRASLMSGRYAYNTGMNEYNQHQVTTEELSGVPKTFDFIPKVPPPRFGSPLLAFGRS